MRQLKIGPRLAAAFGLVLLVLGGITVLSLARLSELNDKIESAVRDRYPKLLLIGGAFENVKDSSIHLRNLLILDDPARVQAERAALDASDASATDFLQQFTARMTAPQARQIVADLYAAKRAYEADKAAYLQLLADGDREAATALIAGNLSTHLSVYEGSVGKLNKLGGKLMKTSADEAEKAYRDGQLIISGMALAALLLASALSYWISRSITVPLRNAVALAETIATGNLASDIDCRENDETGRLLQALQTMNTSLAKIVVDVRANAQAISGSAGEIAGGTMDLSSRTEEQASSLEETAASMEELTSTVKQGLGTAREALELSRSAAQVAEKSGAQVHQVVERMATIEAASRKITDIINVIDGIAFQTNILALNAAVEAARAGESGRGFAVVASEVRNLAQRSAGAAREIKELIEDSVAKIAAGNENAREAGLTMALVQAEIKRVALLMNEFESASREQTIGIEQINRAVVQMDHVTQQNASLVAQTAHAAENMHRRTEAMVASVQVFVVKDEPEARPARPRLAGPVTAAA